MDLGISQTRYWKLTSINLLVIVDIANRLIDSESDIQTYFWESMQLYYGK